MNIRTDFIVRAYIENVCPLKGAVFLDYVLTDKFSTDHIHGVYKNPRFFEAIRPDLNLDMARGNFWRLVRKYACPTKYEVGLWVKCLLRNCYAIGVTALRGEGSFAGQTQFPLSVLDDPLLVIKMMNALGDIKLNKMDPNMDAAEYKEFIGKIDQGNIKSYAPLIQWLAQFFYGPDDEEGKKHVDLNNYRGVAEESILTLLYAHIVQCVGQMREWHAGDSDWNGATFELSGGFSQAWESVLPPEKNHNAIKWLRFPSMVVAATGYKSDRAQVANDAPLMFIEMAKNKPDAFKVCQNVLFYSDFGTGVEGNIIGTINRYIMAFVQSGLPINTQFAHADYRVDEYSVRPKDTIEIYNFERIHHPYMYDYPEGSVVNPTKEVSDEKAVEEETQQVVIKSEETSTPGGTDPDPTKKKTVPTTYKDVVDKTKVESTSMTLLIVCGAVLAFAFS